jgi:hypothetical protein
MTASRPRRAAAIVAAAVGLLLAGVATGCTGADTGTAAPASAATKEAGSKPERDERETRTRSGSASQHGRGDTGPAAGGSRAGGAACSAYATQAEAQRAGDTRDADGDGRLCESLPCPCAGPGSDQPPDQSAVAQPAANCIRPRGVQPISFSATRYPRIRAHALAAQARGWPRRLVLNRQGADARRERLLQAVPTRDGLDRDEYPPAVGRGRGAGLTAGADPRGWRADVRYVPSAENRSHGARLGIKLRRFCDGTRFRYVFY